MSLPVLEDYDISPRDGFLPREDPCEALPTFYEPWECLIKGISRLIASTELRPAVERLPVLPTSYLFGAPRWRRAYTVLGFLIHSYMWAGAVPNERIPCALSIPFLAVCEYVELPPVATYAGLVLWNCKRGPNWSPMRPLENLTVLETFTGTADEKWFYLVSFAIEAKAAHLVPMLLASAESAIRNDHNALISSLRDFSEQVGELDSLLARLPDGCDPNFFYTQLRPFLTGSSDERLCHGVIFEHDSGITRDGVRYSGGSNAQSSLFQYFDIILSVGHSPSKHSVNGRHDKLDTLERSHSPASSFIHQMRQYMPGPHARFLAATEAATKRASIRDFVQMNANNSALSDAYNAAINALASFRNRHLQIVSRYVIVPAHRAQVATGKGPYPTVAKTSDESISCTHGPSATNIHSLRGTGGTAMIPFLRQVRDETTATRVSLDSAGCMLQRPSVRQRARSGSRLDHVLVD